MALQSALQPRGIRNNNPLNLRISNVNWKGKRPLAQNTDGAFEQFDTMLHGIRAAILNIRTYISKYHCDTPSAIISRWAPSSDGNNVAAYVGTVCRLSGLHANEVIGVNDRKRIVSLVHAMIYVECGQCVDINTVNNAWAAL